MARTTSSASRTSTGATAPRRPDGAAARWFVALRPDPAARQRLADGAAQLARHLRGRPVAADRVHLTLLFVGSAPRSREPDMLAAVRALPPAPPLALERVGGFGDRVAWIGPAACPPWLQAMADQLRSVFDELGIGYDRKRFVPHVTLVRGARPPAPGLAPAPPALATIEVAHWSACLVESELLAHGSRYRWLGA